MLRAVRLVRDPFAAHAARARGDRSWFRLSLAAAFAAHALAAAVVPRHTRQRFDALRFVTETFELAPERPAEPEPPREPEPPQPKLAVPAADRKPAPRAERSAQKASEVLTSVPNDDGPVDLTDTIVSGTATEAAHGKISTRSFGTSKTSAAPSSSRGDGSGEARRTARRRASLEDGSDWRCPFPSEADQAGVNEAWSTLSVDVARDGSAERVTVLRDPGYGFGVAARRCALQRRYEPARAEDGRAVSDVLVVRVRFVR